MPLLFRRVYRVLVSLYFAASVLCIIRFMPSFPYFEVFFWYIISVSLRMANKDKWDLFKVYIRNLTNIISSYPPQYQRWIFVNFHKKKKDEKLVSIDNKRRWKKWSLSMRQFWFRFSKLLYFAEHTYFRRKHKIHNLFLYICDFWSEMKIYFWHEKVLSRNNLSRILVTQKLFQLFKLSENTFKQRSNHI